MKMEFKPKRRLSKSFRWFCFILLFGACSNPKELDVTNVEWKTYTNEDVGYEMVYPGICMIQEYSNRRFVMFRFESHPEILVRFTGKEESTHNGIWFDHEPASDIQLAGVEGKKYDYVHYDGPFSERTVAYVIPYRDKYLGLEFRTKDNPDEKFKQVIESFKLLDEKKPTN